MSGRCGADCASSSRDPTCPRCEGAGQRTPDRARHRTGDDGGQHADSDEDGDGAEADQLDGGLRQPQGERGDTDDGHDRPDDDAPSRRFSFLASVIDERRHRRDPHGPPGRADGGDHGHAHAHDDGRDDGTRLEHQGSRWQGDPEPLEQRFESERGQDPQAQADQGGHQTQDGGFEKNGAEHLLPAGPDDAAATPVPSSADRR